MRVAVAGVGVSVAAVAVTLAVSMPVVAGLSGMASGMRSSNSVVGAWTSVTVSTLAGKTEKLLLLARCPIVRNDSALVPLLLQSSIRNRTALDGPAG